MWYRTLDVYVKSLRPLDSLGYVVVALIGAGSFAPRQGIPAASLLAETFLIAEALMGSIFLLNNRFDYAADRAAGSTKASKNPIAQGLIGLRKAEVLSIVFMLLGLVATTLWAYNLFSILLYLVAWAVGLMYSAPPLRLKAHAGFDILSHGAVVIALFLMGFSFANTFSILSIVFAFPFFMLSTIYEVRNHLKDWAADSSAGIRTSISAVGLQRGRQFLWLSVLLFWSSLLAAGYILGVAMLLLVVGTTASYLIFLTLGKVRQELVFDLHLWAMGGVYSAFKLLVLARLI